MPLGVLAGEYHDLRDPARRVFWGAAGFVGNHGSPTSIVGSYPRELRAQYFNRLKLRIVALSGCATQKFHLCLGILPSRETVCSDAQTSRGRCLTETGRNRGTPANGRDEPDRGTKRRVLRPVHASRCRGTALATRRGRRSRIVSFGWDRRFRRTIPGSERN